MLPSWLVPHLSSLTGSQPYGNGRVTIGFGFDALWLPKDIVVSTFNKVREIGIKLITTHYINTNHPMSSPHPIPFCDAQIAPSDHPQIPPQPLQSQPSPPTTS